MSNILIAHITTVHNRNDTRIRFKQVETLSSLYPNNVALIVQDGLGNENTNKCYKIFDTGNKFQSRILRASLGSLRMLVSVLKLKPKIVHFHDPELIPIAAIMLLFNIKVIYDIHEDLPNQILSKPYLKPKYFRHLVSKIANTVELQASRVFSKLIVTTESIAQRFPAEKTILVRNYPKISTLLENKPPPKSKEKFVINYSGSLTETRGIIDLVKAMELLPPTYKMQFLGNFHPSSLEAVCKSLPGWEKCEYLGRVPHSQIGQYIGSAHLGVQMTHDIANYSGGIATKIFEYLVMGVPTLMSDTVERREQYGAMTNYAKPGDPRQIAIQIQNIKDNYDLVVQNTVIAKETVQEIYTWEKEAEKLARTYIQLLDTSKDKVNDGFL